MSTITAANAVVMLSTTLLFPTPVQLQGYSADDIFTTQPIKNVEALMGVDGNASYGWIPVLIEWDINLQADSASNALFDLVYSTEQTIQEKIIFNGLVSLPSIGTSFNLVKGVLSTYPPMPDAGKTLKPRKFGMTWESISPVPVSV